MSRIITREGMAPVEDGHFKGKGVQGKERHVRDLKETKSERHDAGGGKEWVGWWAVERWATWKWWVQSQSGLWILSINYSTAPALSGTVAQDPWFQDRVGKVVVRYIHYSTETVGEQF